MRACHSRLVLVAFHWLENWREFFLTNHSEVKKKSHSVENRSVSVCDTPTIMTDTSSS